MLTESLTERQRAVYLFIEDKINNRGYGPTVREICVEFDIKSPNGVVCHLKALEKKGLIKRTPKQSRAIELVNPGRGNNHHELSAVAGRLNNSSSKEVSFTHLFDFSQQQVIQIEGDALADANIVSGDYVIVHSASDASVGSIVLIKSANGVNSLKYVEPDMTLPDAEVIGVVAGVVRTFPNEKS